MSTQLDQYHYRIGVKIDSLDKINKCILSVQDGNSGLIRDLTLSIESIRSEYNDGSASILAAHYTTPENQNISENYIKFIMSSNLIERMDKLYIEQANAKIQGKMSEPYEIELINVKPINSSYEDIDDSLETLALQLQQQLEKIPAPKIVSTTRTLGQVLETLSKTYQDQLIPLPINKIRINLCSVCTSPMTLFSDQSELRCDSLECGQIVTLYGIVFEDAQFYNQQTTCSKSKKYDPNGHLSKWIDKIQAKEDYLFPQEVINKIDAVVVSEYSRNGRIRPMTNMRCETVREWLQRFRFTDSYDHAPLLRKIITSMHGTPVIPPEFTPIERQEILIECSLSLREFETVIKDPELLRRLEKDRVRNKFYYPYVLWQIINLKVRDLSRKRRLLECIHLQSDKTLRNNDIVWKEICDRRGYKYSKANNNF